MKLIAQLTLSNQYSDIILL